MQARSWSSPAANRFLRPDVFDIARYGTGKGFRMCLATNGTLVTDTVCKSILDAQIKMVSLSLDGAKAETHDNFRNQTGAFAGTMNAIRLFNKYHIPFLVNSSFTLRNRKEIPDIYRLVKSLGATAWYMFMIVPTGRGEDIMEELIPEDVYDEILEWHYEVEKQENELLMRPTCAPTTTALSARKIRNWERKINAGACSFPLEVPKAAWPVSSSVSLTSTGKCSHAATLPNQPATLKRPPLRQSGKNRNFSFNFVILKGIRIIVVSANMLGCAVDVGPGPTP